MLRSLPSYLEQELSDKFPMQVAEPLEWRGWLKFCTSV